VDSMLGYDPLLMIDNAMSLNAHVTQFWKSAVNMSRKVSSGGRSIVTGVTKFKGCHETFG
jgi:hypothetical protein